VQSHHFSVGSIVSWAEPGVGAVATQSVVEPAYGPRGLGQLRRGASAPDALRRLLGDDEQADVRQVAMVDKHGRVAVHTGARCIREAGHRLADGVSAQANMMERPTVPGEGWRELLRRLPASGLLPDDDELIARLTGPSPPPPGEANLRGGPGA